MKCEPVFVVGHPRSGTTLLSVLLDRHSEIAVTPETNYFYTVIRQLRKRRSWEKKRLVEFLFAQTNLRDLGLDVALMQSRLSGGALDASAVFEAAMSEYGKRRGKRLVIEKTPYHVSYLFDILRHFPSAKIIWIVRDGRDTVLSLQRVPWATDRIWELSLQWRRNMQLALRFQEKNPDSLYRIYYEDLVAEPAAELQKLLAFLGLAFESGQMDETVEAPVFPKWESGWKDKAKTTIDSSRATAWKESANGSTLCLMNVLMGQALERLGYGNTDVTECGPFAGFSRQPLDLLLAMFFDHRVYRPIVDLYWRFRIT